MNPNDVQKLKEAVEQSIDENKEQDSAYQERLRLQTIMGRVARFIDENALRIQKEVEAAEEADIRENGMQGIRLAPHQYMAEKIYDAMLEQEGELPSEITVREGSCAHLNGYQWFVIAGDPRKVQDVSHNWLIDPTPPGLHVVFPDTQRITGVGIVVWAPHAHWQKVYDGQVIRGGPNG